MDPNAEKTFIEVEEKTPTNSKENLKDNKKDPPKKEDDAKVQSSDAGLEFRDNKHNDTKRWSDGSNYEDAESSCSSADQTMFSVISGDETLKNSTMESTRGDGDDSVAK